MASCIRCGNPCADGASMCEDCKAWYESKSKGKSSNIPKIKPTPAKNEPKKPVETAGANENPAPSNGSTTTRSGGFAGGAGSGGSNNSVDKKPVNVKLIGIIAGVIALIAVLAVVMTMLFNKDSDGDKKKKSDDVVAEQSTGSEQQDDNAGEAADSEEPVNDETESENTASTTEASAGLTKTVLRLQKQYESQQAEYTSRSDWESVNLDGMTLYYFDNTLREAYVENGSEIMEFSYFNEEVYYARISNPKLNQLYWDDQNLICWIEPDGTIHNEEYNSDDYMNMDSYWYEASNIYANYWDISLAKPAETTTQAPTQETTQAAAEYIFPNSDTSYLSESDLVGKSKWELKVGRNEIMARHGRKFNDNELQTYFNGCTWYHGTLSPEDFDKKYDTMLNDYEKKNANLILNYEKKMGYR